MKDLIIKGNILNVFSEEIYPAEITVENGTIKCVKSIEGNFKDFPLIKQEKN